MMADIEGLVEAIQRADTFLPPSPWATFEFAHVVQGESRGGDIVAADGESIVAQCVMPDDIEALVWVRNNLPTIAATITALQAENERLTGLLREHAMTQLAREGQHCDETAAAHAQGYAEAKEQAAGVADEYAGSSTPTRDTIDIVRHDEAKGIATAIRAMERG